MNYKVPLEKILQIACDAVGDTVEENKSRYRPDYLADSRFIYARLARNEAYRYAQISEVCNRTHSTIGKRLREHEDRYETDKYYKRCFDDAEQMLENYKNGIITEIHEGILQTPYGERKATIITHYNKYE